MLLYAFDLLELDGEDLRREPFETRNLKGPGSFDASGIPLHEDNQTVVKERIYLDKAKSYILHDEVTKGSYFPDHS